MDSVLYSFGPFVSMFVANFAIVFKFLKAKCKSNCTESTNQALVKAATRGTMMVVTVSVTFLILTAPTAVDQAVLHVIHLASDPMYQLFMNVTQYLNHSINGLLYCLVGSRFRNEFLKILCRKKRTVESSASYSVGNTSVTTISGTRLWHAACPFDESNAVSFYFNYTKLVQKHYMLSKMIMKNITIVRKLSLDLEPCLVSILCTSWWTKLV